MMNYKGDKRKLENNQKTKILISRRDKNVLTPEMIQYIHTCVNEIQYGRVIIELNEHLKKLDIIVEKKQRFDK